MLAARFDTLVHVAQSKYSVRVRSACGNNFFCLESGLCVPPHICIFFAWLWWMSTRQALQQEDLGHKASSCPLCRWPFVSNDAVVREDLLVRDGSAEESVVLSLAQVLGGGG